MDTWFETDVSGLPIGFHVQGSGFLNSLTLEDGTDSSPETSVLNHLTLLNNSEDGRITQRRLVVSYLRFGTTCRSQSSKVKLVKQVV